MPTLNNKNKIHTLYSEAIQTCDRTIKIFTTVRKKNLVENNYLLEYINVLIAEKKELIYLVSQKGYKYDKKIKNHRFLRFSYTCEGINRKLYNEMIALINNTIFHFRTVHKKGLIINERIEPFLLFEDKLKLIYHNAMKIQIQRKNLFELVYKNNPSANQHLQKRIEEINKKIEYLEAEEMNILKARVKNQLLKGETKEDYPYFNDVIYLDTKYKKGLNSKDFNDCLEFDKYPLNRIFRHVNKMAYLNSKFIKLEYQQRKYNLSRLKKEYEYEELTYYTLHKVKELYSDEKEILTEIIKTYKKYRYANFLKCLLHRLKLPHYLKYTNR